VRVELKTIGVPAVTHNCYTKSSTPFEWQTDPCIELRQDKRIRSHYLKDNLYCFASLLPMINLKGIIA